MQFDDRLATVLRMRADSDAVLRTQFRQLIDLLGTGGAPVPSPAIARIVSQARALPLAERERLMLVPALKRGNKPLAGLYGYVRLDEIRDRISQEDQSRILRETGLRLRDPRLAAFLATGEPKPAAAVMATARLTEEQWLELIPTLPVNARGFLRHRRDLSPAVKELLARLGVQDLVLPDPHLPAEVAEGDTLELTDAIEDTAPATTVDTATPAPSPKEEGIGALLRRIEEFREQRQSRPVAPRLPLEEEEIPEAALPGFEFSSDASGVVDWASGPIAPLVVGLRLTSPRPGPLVDTGQHTVARLAAYQPVEAATLTLRAAPEISGEWVLDAAPIFDPKNGSFTGYRGCLRRPTPPEEAANDDGEGDLMRQVLHELRTPVNAIQGFAEIIQQQLFGPAPHEYRAHAAAISVDAAKLLAGFDEVDRLVKLDAAAMALDPGQADMRIVTSETVQRLQGVLRPRNAGFTLRVKGSPFLVPLDRREAMAMAWRLLATAAGALAPGEDIPLTLSGNGKRVKLRMDIPRSLVDSNMPGTGAGGEPRQRAVSAGMFGPGFSFRLAQAEAEAAGGKLKCKKDRVTLILPALTAHEGDSSAEQGRVGG